MNQSDEPLTVRRNKLVGMWAAEKLGLLGENAKAYFRTTSLWAARS